MVRQCNVSSYRSDRQTDRQTVGDFTFCLKTFAATFTEPKLRSKYLLKSKSKVISPSENMATIYSISKLKQSGTKNKRRNGYTMT